jgi:hypothetical protein
MKVFREELAPGYYRLDVDPDRADPAEVERLTQKFRAYQKECEEETARGVSFPYRLVVASNGPK